ncbi:MAG: CRISPR-associated endonuclease Cas2, partial [Candidatus Omnitrophota bacterium]
MFVVISYDIVDDKRRLKIAEKLEDYGARVQFSVFECILDEANFNELVNELTGLIEEEDSLRFYTLCEGCLKRIKVFGT